LQHVNVLIVEDNPHDVLLVETALADHGIPYQLVVVRDGEAAIAYVSSIGADNGAPCPDLLILDINLPRVSGLEVLRLFRGHAPCTDTPVIVCSSSVALKEQARMVELGVTRFFQKTINLDEFLQLGNVVREVVEAKPSG
jgi:CheY-like chemotaxis protein